MGQLIKIEIEDGQKFKAEAKQLSCPKQFYCACVLTLKALQLPFFFFSSFFSASFLDGLAQFLCVLHQLFLTSDQYLAYFVDTLANGYLYVLKFHLWEYDMT